MLVNLEPCKPYLAVIDETDGCEVAQVLDRHEALLPSRLTVP
jgi:hypothetical protein